MSMTVAIIVAMCVPNADVAGTIAVADLDQTK